MLLQKNLSRKISPEKSLDFWSQKSVLPPAVVHSCGRVPRFQRLNMDKTRESGSQGTALLRVQTHVRVSGRAEWRFLSLIVPLLLLPTVATVPLCIAFFHPRQPCFCGAMCTRAHAAVTHPIRMMHTLEKHSTERRVYMQSTHPCTL